MPKFSPSINLIRDTNQAIQYVPTANAHRIYGQLLADYAVGIHAFSVIGSYGTGKSAFLLALEKSLSGQQHFFPAPNGHLGKLQGIEFINIVGSYASLMNTLANHFGVMPEDTSIFEALVQAQNIAKRRGLCLGIVIDEFGKFLEYASRFKPEEELYFIQRLAEFVNDPSQDILLITVLHQNFSTYAAGLNRDQREEWEKVKGRLKELTFNEPVEQLLELAANFSKNGQQPHSDEELAALLETIDLSAAFPHRHRLSTEFASKLIPFDILSASVLTQALQRYGQNERSLFTFLNANDYLGINDYDAEKHPYYNLVCVYDFLAHNYESLINSVHNPHYAQWGASRRTQERAEAELSEESVHTAIALLKVIGLLSIFAPDGARINPSFLAEYGRLALGLDNVTDVLAELETRKLIRYIRFKDTFVLFEGTDLNIELALMEAEGKVDPIHNVALLLQEHFEFPLLLAKAASFRTGTPRFFRFQLSEEPSIDMPEGLYDGVVNLVFSKEDESDALDTNVSPAHTSILYGFYQKPNQIRQTLHEIQKINYVLGVNRDDRVAVRELQRLKAEYIEQLNRQTLDSLYDGNSLTWIWNGAQYDIRNTRALNNLLSQICDFVYAQTPHFYNELVNRHKVSSAVSTARRYYFRALVENWQQPELGYPVERFPAEKSIYLTLLKQTGIHREEAGQYLFAEPTESSFRALWDACTEFLDSAKTTPRNLNQLVETLSQPPFKIKEGLVGFWVPTFIFAKREEFALYYDGSYTPQITSEILDLIQKEPEKFRVKSFVVDGVRLQFLNRFRLLVEQTPSEQISNSSFIETIRPFLTFYRSLPAYAQQTAKLEPRTIRLREVIARATDPEKTFFEDFPAALGFSDIVQGSIDDGVAARFVQQLQDAIRELRNCYDKLVDRIEEYLLDIVGVVGGQFPDYRENIKARYQTLRPAEMLPRQRTLLLRLTSELDDRDAWLNSVVQVVAGRDIRRLRDDDEEVVYAKLRTALQELDNLSEIDKLKADLENELPPVAVEITTAQQGSRRLVHRLTRQKESAVSDLEAKLRQSLTDDELVNASALIRLLQGMLADG